MFRLCGLRFALCPRGFSRFAASDESSTPSLGLLRAASPTGRALRAPPATATSPIRNGRSASSHRPALTLARCSVAAHYALLRVLATSALRAFGRSQAHSRLSPLVPTIRNSRLASSHRARLRRPGVPPLRTPLCPVSSGLQPLRGLRLRAALPLARLLCSLDFRFACFRHWRRRSSVPIGLTTACFRHRRRPSCAPTSFR